MVRALVLETSHRLGRVALAQDNHILGERLLDESRRHTRELTPAVRQLLEEQNWKPADLEAIFVSRGPGSYTGLRVGLMAAKMLAYSLRCGALAIDTFSALAQQAPTSALQVDVLADAQQDKIYVQRFDQDRAPVKPLAIIPFADWLLTLTPEICVLGPGLEIFAPRLPESAWQAERNDWLARSPSILNVALMRWQRGERDDPFQIEPLYLRPSSAEEKWNLLGRK